MLGSKPTVVEFMAYPYNPNICVVSTLKAYLECTSALHDSAQQLFVSHSKLFKPVSQVMKKSGIDATSKAFLKSVKLEHILTVEGWSAF